MFPHDNWGVGLTKLEETAHLLPITLLIFLYSSHFLFQTALSNISQGIELIIPGHKTVNISDQCLIISTEEDCLNVLFPEIGR